MNVIFVNVTIKSQVLTLDETKVDNISKSDKLKLTLNTNYSVDVAMGVAVSKLADKLPTVRIGLRNNPCPEYKGWYLVIESDKSVAETVEEFFDYDRMENVNDLTFDKLA